jgi:hypothetical protein
MLPASSICVTSPTVPGRTGYVSFRIEISCNFVPTGYFFRSCSRYDSLGNCISITNLSECGITGQMPKNNLSCRLEFCTHHSQTNQETPHGVLGIVGGVRLAVDAALVLGKFAEHGNEGAVGICVAVLFDREPWKFHLFIS